MTASPDEHGWYPCADVLPPINETVRLWNPVRHEETHGCRVLSRFHENQWAWRYADGTSDSLMRFSHWQPILPPVADTDAPAEP